MMARMHSRAALLLLTVVVGCSSSGSSGEPLDGPVMRYTASPSEDGAAAEVKVTLEDTMARPKPPNIGR